MAVLSESQVQGNISKILALPHFLFITQVSGFKTREAAWYAANIGELVKGSDDQVKEWRRKLNTLVDLNQVRSALANQWQEYARALNLSPSESGSTLNIIKRVKRYMAENSGTVKSRNMTLGTPVDPGTPNNAGNGVIYRLGVDEFNQPLEAISVPSGDKKWEVIADQNDKGTSKNSELFKSNGGTKIIDNLDRVSGDNAIVDKQIKAWDNKNQIHQDGCFLQTTEDSGGLINSMGPWETDSLDFTNIALQDSTISSGNDYFYRANVNQSPRSIKFTGNRTLIQSLPKIDRARPVFMEAIWRADIPTLAPATTTTIDIELGSNSKQAVYNGSDTGWKRLALDLDQNCWPRNFLGNDPKIKVAVAIVSDALFVTEVKVGYMNEWDGSYFVICGGSDPFLKGTTTPDRFTWQDSAAASVVIQFWMFILYGICFPSTTGSPSWVDPT